ncbi:permease [Nitratifractor sp.]|uniref:permease n=1 Tax=Nitratifractor sp. TaxID=2268144 RepID=UPI0025EDC78D|nr:permease [Nitratifractor sp.]
MSAEKSISFPKSLKQAGLSMLSMMPMILAIIGLVGLFQSYVSEATLASVFNGNAVHDTLVGTLAGMVAVGQAIVSYILGGELLKEGVSLYAVTAFILAWVTLGVVQLPLEASVLGVRFTWRRNLLAFFSTMLVAVMTVRILEWWR